MKEFMAMEEWIKKSYAPGIDFGARLQSVNGKFLYYAYSLGLSLPLSGKPKKSKIQASRLETNIQQEKLKKMQLELHTTLVPLEKESAFLAESINMLRTQSLPLAMEQMKLAKLSWESGESDFTTLLNSIENEIRVRELILDQVFEYTNITLEINYLTGYTN